MAAAEMKRLNSSVFLPVPQPRGGMQGVTVLKTSGSPTFTMSETAPSLSEDHGSERSNDSIVIQGELENHEEVKRLNLKTHYLWALGISIALGGQYIGWNKSLHAGFGSALIATMLIASAYWCLVLCISEISSAIPFGGEAPFHKKYSNHPIENFHLFTLQAVLTASPE